MDAKVLVVGGGGREHALAWKLARSPRVAQVFVAPGNGGTAVFAKNVAIAATDAGALVTWAKQEGIALAVVGPDDALALGVADAFREAGIPAFGPSRAAAEIESSKAFAKEFMARHDIPTAAFRTFSDHASAREYALAQQFPVVLKASGLALGKGVIIARTADEIETALDDIFVRNVFGDAGSTVVIEDYLDGPEISIHVFADGKDFALLPTAQDHKSIFEGGQGPNTGGMGTVAPLPWLSSEDLATIEYRIVAPALAGLAAEGRPFSGLLYPGLKMTSRGPMVLEFNARFGDPETQSYMRLLESDLFEVCMACASGRLADIEIKWRSGAACCVILASEGYPGPYEKGKEISGVEEAEAMPEVVVFHAGTTRADGKLVTSGGRVLGVTATGADIAAATARAYEAAKKITFAGMQYRRDIGLASMDRTIAQE